MDQVAKYRQLSEQLRASAGSQIYPESRAQMLQLAEHWESAAEQLERHIRAVAGERSRETRTVIMS